jgi:hypothetical protein
MSTRTVRPSVAPCTGHDRFRTYGEFAAACTNIRPWDEAGLIIGECKRCRSTLSFEGEPHRNPSAGTHPDLFGGETAAAQATTTASARASACPTAAGHAARPGFQNAKRAHIYHNCGFLAGLLLKIANLRCPRKSFGGNSAPPLF